MAKPPRHTNQQQNNQQVTAQVQTVTTHYQGIVPHPDVLRGLDEIVPGTAARLVKLAEEESLHRRELEIKANEANISAQQYQLRIAEQQSKAVFRSDLLGQIAGFIVCLACISASVYLGVNGHDWLAGTLALIPTGALIRAFVLNRKSKIES
jgi:uncharacterized membrane protein